MQGSLNDDFSEHGDGDLSDLDDTSESMSLNPDDLAATGRNQVLSDIDITGTNESAENFRNRSARRPRH